MLARLLSDFHVDFCMHPTLRGGTASFHQILIYQILLQSANSCGPRDQEIRLTVVTSACCLPCHKSCIDWITCFQMITTLFSKLNSTLLYLLFWTFDPGTCYFRQHELLTIAQLSFFSLSLILNNNLITFTNWFLTVFMTFLRELNKNICITVLNVITALSFLAYISWYFYINNFVSGRIQEISKENDKNRAFYLFTPSLFNWSLD